MHAQRGTLRIGTRASALARKQTSIVVELLLTRNSTPAIEIVHIQTDGDRIQNRSITDLGDKGVFVRPLEAALHSRVIDLAVHSLKDVPSDDETPDLELAAFLPREDPADVLVASRYAGLNALPSGARIGTGSSRRKMQLLVLRPDLVFCDIRGNVDTRLRKLDAGEYDALVLAAAGLRRLNLTHRITEVLPLIPDAGQGIIVLQSRRGDSASNVGRSIDDPTSRACALAERAVVKALGADCRSPVGAYAKVSGDTLHLEAVAATLESGRSVREAHFGRIQDAEKLGTAIGSRLLRTLSE